MLDINEVVETYFPKEFCRSGVLYRKRSVQLAFISKIVMKDDLRICLHDQFLVQEATGVSISIFIQMIQIPYEKTRF